jgi:hypothetical protein
MGASAVDGGGVATSVTSVAAESMEVAPELCAARRPERPPPLPPPAGPPRPGDRRARSWHAVDSLADPQLPLLPVDAVEHAIAEAWRLFKLALTLFGYLGLGGWQRRHGPPCRCPLHGPVRMMRMRIRMRAPSRVRGAHAHEST